MSVPGQILSTCPARERLVTSFIMLLDSYNLKLASRLNEMGIERATEQSHEEYIEYITASKALLAHEREHGCMQ